MGILSQSPDFDSMSERNLDANGLTSVRFNEKAMLSILGIVARIAISLGGACVLTKTVPSIPNKWVYRFVFLFVLGVPLNFVVNYFDVRLLGYHKMGWGGAFIIALLLALFFATFGTFWEPQPTQLERKSRLRG
jgi:hypothetical protein